MRKIICFLMFLLLLVFITQNVNATGLSVLPASIKASNLVRGQQFNITIIIYNPNDYEETFSINASDEIKSWVSFYSTENLNEQINKIVIPTQSSGNVIANFKIPKDVANGNYLSKIYIQSAPTETSGGNTSSISIRVPIEVSLDVAGSQISAGRVIDIRTADTEINRFLRIEVEFQNAGEVIDKPRIEVVIKKNGTEISNFVHDKTSVNVGNKSTIDVLWVTTSQTVGDYVANVKVFLGSKLLSEKNLNFKILERGTLTASGKVVNVTSNKTINSGSISKIVVGFLNTGEIDFIAKISGEVYLNNNIVDTLESDETLIKTGKTETLTAYFKPTKDGLYLIKSNVVYEGKKEPINDMMISVGSSPIGMALLTSPNNAIIIAVIIVVIIFVIIYFKKIRKSY